MPSAPSQTIVANGLEELTLDDAILEVKSRSDNLLGIDFELVEMTPANSPSLATVAPVSNAAATAVDVLGFEVRYGTQTDEEVARLEPVRPIAVRVPTPPPAPAIPSPATRSPEPASTVNTKSGLNGSNSAARTSAAADESARERRIRLPKLRFG